METTEASIRRCIDRNESLHDVADRRRTTQQLLAQAWPEGIKYQDSDTVVVTTAPIDEDDNIGRLTVEQVMTRHQLDPEIWEAQRVLPNVWEANAGGGIKIPLYQFKVWFLKKVPIDAIFPATVGPRIAPPKQPDYSQPILTVIPTDQQNPYRLGALHELFLRFLKENRPAQGIVAGDLLDFGHISRHRDDPAWAATVQDCIQTGFDCLYDYRNAYEDCAWTLIKGNHEDRLRNEMLERSERLYGLTAAQYPGEEPEEWVYSLGHLLHLKRLGVVYSEPIGTYEFVQVPITDQIAVRHGHKTVKGGALKTVEELGHSVVVGHTHRQSINRKTRWNSITNTSRVITAVEAGCMCQTEGGLGYANAGTPDWQNGFVTVTSFPDGGFSVDLASFEQEGILRWRDQVYSL